MKLPARLWSKSTHTTFYRSKRGKSPPRSCHPRPTVYRHTSALAHSHAVVYSYLEVKTKNDLLSMYTDKPPVIFSLPGNKPGVRSLKIVWVAIISWARNMTPYWLCLGRERCGTHLYLLPLFLLVFIFPIVRLFMWGCIFKQITAYCHAIYLQ